MYHTYRMPKYCECEKHCNKCKPITCCVGPTGSSGPAGPPGKNGANGANGANGPMGPTGGSPLDFLYFNDNEQYYISPTFDSATKRFIGLGATKEYRADRPPRLPFLRTVGYTVSHDFSLSVWKRLHFSLNFLTHIQTVQKKFYLLQVYVLVQVKPVLIHMIS